MKQQGFTKGGLQGWRPFQHFWLITVCPLPLGNRVKRLLDKFCGGCDSVVIVELTLFPLRF